MKEKMQEALEVFAENCKSYDDMSCNHECESCIFHCENRWCNLFTINMFAVMLSGWDVGDMEPNKKYKEIKVLDKMLTDAGIPHTIERMLDGYQICYPSNNEYETIAIAVQNYGVRGIDDDLLALMGLLTAHEEEHGDVAGYLTAQNVFDRISADWSNRKDDRCHAF